MKTTNDIAQSSWFIHHDPKFVSDQNLALVVRKMALHADIASKMYRSQKESANLYGDKWYERLKQINRIKNMSKDFLAKQQQQQQQQQQQKSPANFNTMSLNSNSMAATLNSATNTSNQTGQLDFTVYI